MLNPCCRSLFPVALFLGAAVACGVPSSAQKPTAAATPAIAEGTTVRAVPHGRLEKTADGLRIVRLWGTPTQRGTAHAELLAPEIADLVRLEFGARFGTEASHRRFEVLRRSVSRLVDFPSGVEEELDGLFAGLAASGVDLELALPGGARDLDRTDLVLVAALDAVGLGCSGFTVWGDRVVGGGVLSGRNFDWPLTGPHLVDRAVVFVHHPSDGTPWATVGWPGYLGAVTAVNAVGAAVYLHTGNGVRGLPQPESWPTAIVAREILERSTSDGEARVVLAEELVGFSSPPVSYITRLVAPEPLATGTPVTLLEADIRGVTRTPWPMRDANPSSGFAVVTNHFQSREGSHSLDDSTDRWRGVSKCLDGFFGGGDGRVSVEEGWQALDDVAVGYRRFGTLHSLIFRAHPWVFQLRMGQVDGGNPMTPATRADRRYDLAREQLFPDLDPTDADGN